LNIGTGRGYSVLQVVAAAEQVLQRRIPLELVDRRPGDVACIWAQTDLAADVLGWTATRDLTKMLEDHWRWQKAHPNGFGAL
jgi:UDP-glucose 4-epimerase